MARHRLSAAALIPAPATKVYALIADYRSGHPRLLPKEYFVELNVEEGGTGAGTVVNFKMRLMGQIQAFRAKVSEPEPGRVLVETNLNMDAITTFTIEPRENGRQAYVTITTDTQVPEGWLGKIQGWLTTQMLQPVYVKELEQLAQVAAE